MKLALIAETDDEANAMLDFMAARGFKGKAAPAAGAAPANPTPPVPTAPPTPTAPPAPAAAPAATAPSPIPAGAGTTPPAIPAPPAVPAPPAAPAASGPWAEAIAAMNKYGTVHKAAGVKAVIAYGAKQLGQPLTKLVDFPESYIPWFLTMFDPSRPPPAV